MMRQPSQSTGFELPGEQPIPALPRWAHRVRRSTFRRESIDNEYSTCLPPPNSQPVSAGSRENFRRDVVELVLIGQFTVEPWRPSDYEGAALFGLIFTERRLAPPPAAVRPSQPRIGCRGSSLATGSTTGFGRNRSTFGKCGDRAQRTVGPVT